MDLISYQTCASNDYWHSVSVPSRSEKGRHWQVLIPCPGDRPGEFICGCPGYIFRAKCAHQDIAAEKICKWDGPKGPETQSPKQEAERVCPRCGGETIVIREFI